MKEFNFAFIEHFFPLELRKAKLTEFINFKQGKMRVKEYAFKFTKLSKYASSLVADTYAKMNKFISRILNLVVKVCHTATLMKEMDISWLMTYDKQIEGEKLKKSRVRESKRAQFKVEFSNARSSIRPKVPRSKAISGLK